jgi:pimeloyl-ACP methyl ester carboxylesterase
MKMAKNSIYKSDERKKQILGFYETLLSQWHQPSRKIILETIFGETFIIESGDNEAPVIILLHGSGSNSAMWIADVKELSIKYHVFAVDIIGECGKSSENRPNFKTDDFSNWILEIIEKLGLNQISIIGCSLGGWIAMDFTIKHPERVEKLVLMATAGITQVKLKTIFWIILTSFMGSWGFNKLNKMVYGNLDIDKQALEFASMIKLYYIPRTDVLPVFTNDSLHQIKAYTLFIGGKNDCFYNSQKTASRLKENLEKVQWLVLENTGHVLINQSKRILQFLKYK